MGTPNGSNKGDYLVCTCEDSQTLKNLINCIQSKKTSAELSKAIDNLLKDKKDKWAPIRNNTNNLDLYDEFHKNILKVLWEEFSNQGRNKDTYQILETHKYNADNADKFFFQMLYRTYEALGTYCFLNGIYNQPTVASWVIETKTNQ